MEQRLCLQCGKKLVGRRDKLFCNVDCKNQHHNEAMPESKVVFKRVTKILKRNRDILKEVLGGSKKMYVEVEKLEALGFDRDYLTHTKRVTGRKEENIYYYIFDYGYRIEPNGSFMVVQAYH